MFGQDAYLKAPFYFISGDFTVTSGHDDTHCTITRRPLNERPQICQCSLKLEELLRALARLGAEYPEAVEVLQQAERCQALSCPVCIDALPQAVSVQELARAGREPSKAAELLEAGADLTAELRTPDPEIINAGSELGATPNLLEKSAGRRPRSAADRDEQTQLHDRQDK